MSSDDPLEIAEGVYWVGIRLPNDTFQCHAYLIDNGRDSVLLDPGSPLTIEATLAKVDQVCGLDAVRYLVCHHPDPDIAASLPYLSERLTRDDVEVVTEWRAKALIKHYGHRFGYYLVDGNGWRLPLGPDRELEFQLTPYLHFPGAMVSYDTRTRVLFSSDLFGGFVPDSSTLVSHDVDYIIDNARPFHQHYMPSTELLDAGLSRVQERWPDIAMIAPQHGHVIPQEVVTPAFTALKGIDCGVFQLADADLDLKRLLLIAEARSRITQALLTIAEPQTLVSAITSILTAAGAAEGCALHVEVPGEGWVMWASDLSGAAPRAPRSDSRSIDLPGSPSAVLTLQLAADAPLDPDLLRMLADMAPTMRASVDEFVARRETERQAAVDHAAALTDALTGLANRRALQDDTPSGDYALIAVDIDLFKQANDQFGHAAGDRVLLEVASVLTRFVREHDTVYRLGGDEFLLVLPGATEEAAVRIAERIRATLREFDADGMAPGGRVSLSLGVSIARGRRQSEFEEELRRADQALYESKRAGRDGLTVSAAADVGA